MRFLKTPILLALLVLGSMAFLAAGTAMATTLSKYTTPNSNDQLGVGTQITASLESQTALVGESTDGSNFVDICMSSHISGQVESVTPSTHPRVLLAEFEIANCTHKTQVFQNGELEIKHIAGTTNATVVSRNLEITVLSTTFGVSCITGSEGGAVLGTLTGAKSSTGQATLDVNAVLPDAFLCGSDTRLTGKYAITSPTGLTVEAS